ncbi:MAG TPA: carboxypeptidase regulatory-like domain-containing protein, partial [Patescibacteria group bacterium]|nr:carboxypeptidase regulatory-like domain-containing protein [Patescibacteria group bacterium]
DDTINYKRSPTFSAHPLSPIHEVYRTMKKLLYCLLLFIFIAPFHQLSAGSLSGSDGPKQPSAYFLVGGDAASSKKDKVSIVQKDKKFSPDIISLTVGGVVEFPNKDNLVHNVYSAKGALGFFDLGSANTTLPDESNLAKKTMDKPGVIKINCAVHPVMQASIFVIPQSKYHTVSRNGSYTFNNVPAGTYDLMVMDEAGKISKLKSVTVK